MARFQDYYEILGIDPTAGAEDIKAAYRNRAKENHPDLHPDDTDAQTEEMRFINEAYQVLSNPRKRGPYDIEWKSYYRRRGASRKGDIEPVSNPTAPIREAPHHVESGKQHSRVNEKLLLIILVVLVAILVLGVAIKFRANRPGGTRHPVLNRLEQRREGMGPGMMQPGSPPPDAERRLADLRKAVQTDSNNLQAHQEICRILFGLGRLDEALAESKDGLAKIDEMRKAKSGGIDEPTFLEMETGMLLIAWQASDRLGKLPEAKEYLVRLINVTPDDRREQLSTALSDLEGRMGK